MPRAARPCKTFGHAAVAIRDGLCQECLNERERERGSSTARGYDAAHRSARASWEPIVQKGKTRCWRCNKIIQRGQAWHLGHDENGRQRGPEHASDCNLRAAALKTHGKPWTERS